MTGHAAPGFRRSAGLTDEDQQRLKNLGQNGSRDVDGLRMTHCVPNERAVRRR